MIPTIQFHCRTIRIPFETKRKAEIVFDVLRVDAEPKRNNVKKTITLEDNCLRV